MQPTIDFQQQQKHNNQILMILNEYENNISGLDNQKEINQMIVYLVDKQILLDEKIIWVEQFLKDKYPKISLEQTVSTLYQEFQQKLSQLKQNQLSNLLSINPCNYDNYIQEIEQLLLLEQNFEQPKIIKAKQQHNENTEFFISEENVEDFTGPIVQRGIKQIKMHQKYLSQKKVVHVFTKKGFGLQAYKQYLKKRNLDEKQWNFFINELKINNNYKKYLDSAIQATLSTILDFLMDIQGEQRIYLLLKKNIKQIINHLYSLGQPFKSCLLNCMRIVYELKIQEKSTIQEVQNLCKKVAKILS